MYYMSIISILTISIPDFILNIYIAFIIIGERDRLILNNKKKWIQMLSYLLLMSISCYIIRALIPNILFIIIANAIVYMLIIKYTFALKFLKAIISISINMGLSIIIDCFYVPSFTAFINKNMNYQIYSNDLMMFIYNLPVKLILIAFLIALWNSPFTYLNMDRFKKIKVRSLVTIIPMIMIIPILYYIWINNLESLNLLHQIILCFCLILTITSIIFYGRLITYYTKTIRLELLDDIKYDKREMYFFILKVSQLLENGNIEVAENLAKNQLEIIKTQALIHTYSGNNVTEGKKKIIVGH